MSRGCEKTIRFYACCADRMRREHGSNEWLAKRRGQTRSLIIAMTITLTTKVVRVVVTAERVTPWCPQNKEQKPPR